LNHLKKLETKLNQNCK